MGYIDGTDGTLAALGAVAVVGIAAAATAAAGSGARKGGYGPGSEWYEALPPDNRRHADAARAADRIAHAVAQQIGGRRKPGRTGGIIEYSRGYLSIGGRPATPGGDRWYTSFRAAFYPRSAYNEDHGFTMHPRMVVHATSQGLSEAEVAASMARAVKASHFAMPVGGSPPSGSPARKPRNERAAGARWFERLRREEKWELGDQLVWGTFEWGEWGFDRKPSAAFLRGVDEARIHWQMME